MRKTLPAFISSSQHLDPAGLTAAKILDEAELEPVAGGDECLVCGQVFEPGKEPFAELLELADILR